MLLGGHTVLCSRSTEHNLVYSPLYALQRPVRTDSRVYADVDITAITICDFQTGEHVPAFAVSLSYCCLPSTISAYFSAKGQRVKLRLPRLNEEAPAEPAKGAGAAALNQPHAALGLGLLVSETHYASHAIIITRNEHVPLSAHLRHRLQCFIFLGLPNIWSHADLGLYVRSPVCFSLYQAAIRLDC